MNSKLTGKGAAKSVVKKALMSTKGNRVPYREPNVIGVPYREPKVIGVPYREPKDREPKLICIGSMYWTPIMFCSLYGTLLPLVDINAFLHHF